MTDSIEEQIAKILASGPTLDDHLAPFRAAITDLQTQLAEAKTNPQRQAIKRELNKHLRYVSQATAGHGGNKKPSARKVRKDKATEKKLGWLAKQASR